jgi:hypothetical protein
MPDRSQTLDTPDSSKVCVYLKWPEADLLGIGYTASPLYSSSMPRFLRRCNAYTNAL